MLPTVRRHRVKAARGRGPWLRALLWVGLLARGDAGEGPRCAPRQPCSAESTTSDDYFYRIRERCYFKDRRLTISYKETQQFRLSCAAGVALDDPALPALPRAAPVAHVQLIGCAPPHRGYAAVLRALNVSLPLGSLDLLEHPAAPELRAAHFANLSLAELELTPAVRPLHLHAEALSALPATLRTLRLRRAVLAPDALLTLPLTLSWLVLEEVSAPALEAGLARLPALGRLILTDGALERLDLRGTALSNVSVKAPLRELWLGVRVQRLVLQSVLDATLHGECAELREVVLRNVTGALPPRWLARCPNVTRVVAFRSRGALGGEELAGARALRELEARNCGLFELPAHWLRDATALRALDLSGNALERLPSLAANRALEELYARQNRLSPGALGALDEMPALRVLVLDDNQSLRDMCGHSGDLDTNTLSPLERAQGLRRLSLQRCGLRDVCRDWRGLRQLAELDLRENNIHSLGAEDLRWNRAQNSTLDLRRNPVRVDFSSEDYRAALAAPPAAPSITIVLDHAGPCDCYDYWFARVLRECPRGIRAALEPQCAGDDGPRALRDVPLHELACDLPLGCPAGCRCRQWPTGADLHCERAGLTSVPRTSRPGVRELLLAGNNVTRVRVGDVPASLELLDLRDNRVAHVDSAAVALLWDVRPRRLLLAGNPLDCSCTALPLLRALAAEPSRVLDLVRVRCADGRLLADAASRAVAACGAPPVWALTLGALALAALTALAAACLVRPAARHRLKRFLFERGLCLRWSLGTRAADAPGDAARPYDAFVSFSHRDQRYADVLAQRLEGAGLRLCLHERDWVPGDWIPAQIARSVREARRTLVLLSEHFLHSTWARAELREAYGAALAEQRPRLLLVLLPGFTAERAASADPALRAYVERVTYLSWDDAHFWRKLTLALPPTARPAAPAAVQSQSAPRTPPPPP